MTEFSPVPNWEIWLFDAAYPASRVYFWILQVAGLVVCLYALRKMKKKGFILIAIFFLSPFIDLGLRAISHRIYREPIRMFPAPTASGQELHPVSSSPMVFARHISFPLYETILVLGLILIVRGKKLSKTSEI
jgi:hypothetical protein